MKKLFTFLTLCLCLQHAMGQLPWIQIPSGTSQDLNGVHFLDPVFGVALGDSGTALRTTDAGLSWTPMSVPTTEDLVSASFYNQDTGYMVSQFGHPLYTHDGGNTWIKDSITFNGLCFWQEVIADQSDWVWYLYDGCFGNPELITWNRSNGDTNVYPIVNHFPFGWLPRDMEVNYPGQAIVVGDSGMVLRSTNSGETWDIIAFPDASNLYTVSFWNARDGYAYSHDQFYPRYLTQDSGKTWAVDSSWAPFQTFYYPEFYADDYNFSTEVVAGRSSTTNGGIAFYFDNSFLPTTFSILDNVPVLNDAANPQNYAIVVGDSGYIARVGDLVLAQEAAVPEKSLEVYPNPAAEYAYLISPVEIPEGAEIRLYDLQGRMVWQEVPFTLWEGEARRMEFGQLAPGTYLLELSGPEGNWRQRLVIGQ